MYEYWSYTPNKSFLNAAHNNTLCCWEQESYYNINVQKAIAFVWLFIPLKIV